MPQCAGDASEQPAALPELPRLLPRALLPRPHVQHRRRRRPLIAGGRIGHGPVDGEPAGKRARVAADAPRATASELSLASLSTRAGVESTKELESSDIIITYYCCGWLTSHMSNERGAGDAATARPRRKGAVGSFVVDVVCVIANRVHKCLEKWNFVSHARSRTRGGLANSQTSHSHFPLSTECVCEVRLHDDAALATEMTSCMRESGIICISIVMVVLHTKHTEHSYICPVIHSCICPVIHSCICPVIHFCISVMRSCTLPSFLLYFQDDILARGT